MCIFGRLRLRMENSERTVESEIDVLKENKTLDFQELQESQRIQSEGLEQIGDRRSVRRKRPFLLKVLAALYLALAWFGWMRFYGTLNDMSLLSEFLSVPMLAYLAAGGALWALAGLLSAVSLWFGMPIASWFSRAAAAVCFVWYWLDRLFIARSPLADTNRLFALFASLLLLAFAMVVPVLQREKRFLKKDA